LALGYQPNAAATANVTYAGIAWYRYAVLPETLFAGGKNLVVNNAFWVEAWTCGTQSVTNAGGYATTYRVCRSQYTQQSDDSFVYTFNVQ
jgi:hypothetical protein